MISGQYWVIFWNFGNFEGQPPLFPFGYLSGNLIHKPKFSALIQLLICEGYKSRIQNIYTLPMSGSHLLGAIWVWNKIFCLIFPKILLFFTPRVSKKGPVWANMRLKGVQIRLFYHIMVHIIQKTGYRDKHYIKIAFWYSFTKYSKFS